MDSEVPAKNEAPVKMEAGEKFVDFTVIVCVLGLLGLWAGTKFLHFNSDDVANLVVVPCFVVWAVGVAVITLGWMTDP